MSMVRVCSPRLFNKVFMFSLGYRILPIREESIVVVN